MPEINNALAAQIQVPQVDIGKTLLTAGQIRGMQTKSALEEASTAQTQQTTDYNAFLQKEGGGYRPGEINTLAEVAQKRAELAGRVGNVMVNDPRAIRQAIDMAKKSGIPIDPATEDHLLKATPEQIVQYGQNLRSHGETAGGNKVSTGEVVKNQGQYIPEPIQPNMPYTSRTSAATGGPATPATLQADAGASGVAGAVGRTPAQAVADRTPPANVFQPRVVKNPDGTISSSVTPETTGLQASAVDRFKQMQETASRAQGMHSQLDALEHDNEVLNTAGWSSTGAGANAKLSAAKSINSLFETVGLKAPIDPSKVASWEGYNKQSIRAGFELARTLGGHQAESVVQSSVNATPNVENTYFGSKVITNSIRQTVQREVDLYNFSLEKAKTTGTSFGAEAEFNKKFPPKLYSQTAIANAIPQSSVDRLKSTGDEKNKTMFDTTYGKGMADFVMGQH